MDVGFFTQIRSVSFAEILMMGVQSLGMNHVLMENLFAGIVLESMLIPC